MRYSRLTPAANAAIISRYRMGEKMCAIAKAYSVSPALISMKLRAAGLTEPRAQIPKEDFAAAIPEMIRDGCSIVKMSEHYRISPTTMKKELITNNIDTGYKRKHADKETFSRKEIEDIRQMISNGMNVTDIAAHYGTTKKAVRYTMRTNDIPPAPVGAPVRTAERTKKILALIDDGMSQAAIARLMNISDDIVYRTVKQRKEKICL